MSSLHKIQGGVDALKAVSLLRETGKISSDCVLMIDEMYLQKAAQYQDGKYVGVNENGDLYKGILVFMIVGLTKSIPYVIQAIPQVTFTGTWLSTKILESFQTFNKAGFIVRCIVTDNHAANVRAFKCLLYECGNGSSLCINHPTNYGKKTYLFYDTVHLLKNIRNNLINAKKLVFPAFEYHKNNISINCPASFISWADFHKISEKDELLQSGLKKAPKLNYQVLHPGNNKQNFMLAMAIFHETTITAAKSYYPQRLDMSGFLAIINRWWTISNSKQQFSPNILGNAIVNGDGKTDFLVSFANWLENWRECPMFTLTAQTSNAMLKTLRSHAALVEELLLDGYLFVMAGRLQSDPIERRFSQYRQMSGGRFLVSLREVYNSERILACRSLIKENINFWNEDLSIKEDNEDIKKLLADIQPFSDEILTCNLSKDSEEVTTTIAGYITKKLVKRSKCDDCKTMLRAKDVEISSNHYLSLLSRGGLTIPSSLLTDFTCSCFSTLDYVEDFLKKYPFINVHDACQNVLKEYAPSFNFTCLLHNTWGFKFATKIIINIFFNNKQKATTSNVRKEAVEGFKKRQRNKKY